eukprot:NODE_65_length_23997_cov_0.327601.p1 type:complete len:1020 gc:universal NODE_65_length_23997_cov_0.327601:13028-16087(+)
MHLIHKTIQPSTFVRDACSGSFTSAKQPEMITISGSLLTIYSLIKNQLTLLKKFQLMATLISINSIKLPGTTTDLIALTTDSGYFHVFQLINLVLTKVHSEPFGRSGIRKSVPNIYAAVDPKGRAVMTSAIDSVHTTFILNFMDNKHVISSPLLCKSNKSIIFNMCGVDVGFNNPVFCVLACHYEDALQNPDWYNYLPKHCHFYELDLGLNTMLLQHSQLVDSQSNLVVQVPMPASGVIVASRNRLTYIHPSSESIESDLPIDDSLTGIVDVVVNCISLFKSKKQFFYILQLSNGHVFKLEFVENEFKWYYLIKIPNCNNIVIFKSGYIYFTGINQLYQINHFNVECADYYTSTENKSLTLVQSYANTSPLLNIIDYNDNLTILTKDSIAPIETPTVELVNSIQLPSAPKCLHTFIFHEIDYICIDMCEYILLLSITEEIKQLDCPFNTECSLLISVLHGASNSVILQVTKTEITTFSDLSFSTISTVKSNNSLACSNRSKVLVYGDNRLVLRSSDLVELLNIEYSKPQIISITDTRLLLVVGLELQVLNMQGELEQIVMMEYPSNSVSVASNTVLIGSDVGYTTCRINSVGYIYMTSATGNTKTICHNDLVIGEHLLWNNDKIMMDTENILDGVACNGLITTITSDSFNCYEIVSKNKAIKVENIKSVLYHGDAVILVGNDIKIYNVVENNIISSHSAFEPEQSVLTSQICKLDNTEYLVVSTANDFNQIAFTFSTSKLTCYNLKSLINDEIKQSTTVIPDLCFAIKTYRNRIMAGIFNSIRFYEMGKQQLLTKREFKIGNGFITRLDCMGDRIYVGTIHDGIRIIEEQNNELIHFCDDYKSRSISEMKLIDYDTIIVSDKYGGVELVEIPSRLKDDLLQDMYANKMSYERGYLNGAPHRLKCKAAIYCDDLITCVIKQRKDKIILGGINGSIRHLIPIKLKSQLNILQRLEIEMNRIVGNRVNRGQGYRSSYTMKKNVIDYDVLLEFKEMDFKIQEEISNTVESSISEIMTLLQELD